MDRPTPAPSPARRRSGATLLALAATALALAVPVAALADDTDLASAGAAWSAGRLVDGERATTTFDGVEYDDIGLTADVLLALAATATGADTIRSIAAWFEGEVEGYVGAADGAAYAAPTAKAIIVADALGRDARDFGGRDLVADLLALEAADGRFSDVSEFGDFSTPFGQALAVIALERSGVGASSAAIERLVATACPDGGIPAAFDTEPCASDVDATAVTIDALVLAGVAAPAVEAASSWLAAAVTDGAALSTNSLGLAAVALERSGATDDADTARRAIRALAQGCDTVEPGAILADASGAGDSLRATTQAVLGLAGVGYATVTATGADDALAPLDCTGGAGRTSPGMLVGAGALAAALVLTLLVRRRRAAVAP
jgi:hypothetical protein